MLNVKSTYDMQIIYDINVRLVEIIRPVEYNIKKEINYGIYNS